MIAAVVLAAGLSRRMGCDKLHLPVNGVPMYRKTTDLVCEIGFSPRILVTNQQNIAWYGRHLGFHVVPSPHAVDGMGWSVAAGAAALDLSCTGAMFFSCDQPFLTRYVLEILCEEFYKSDKIIVPTVDDTPTAPCIFPFRFFDALKALRGESGGKTVYRAHLDETCFLPMPDSTPFLDLDDRESYETAVRQL